MKKKTKGKAAPVEVLRLLLAELRGLVALTREQIQATKAKRGPRRPRQVELVPDKRANQSIPIDPRVQYDPQVEDLLADVTATGTYVEEKKSARRAKAARRKGR
jgi:hypothetical protein